MKLVFLSNYYTHHQSFLCKEWYALTGGEFSFVATESFADERKQMGWREDKAPFTAEYGNKTPDTIMDADTVVYGSAPLDMIKARLEAGKCVFKYSERVFKKGYSYLKWLPRLLSYRRMYGKYKNLYLLAASAFAASDFAMHRTFVGKSYKWGYFPETKEYDIKALLSAKNKRKILWCARLISWKHPEAAIETAQMLLKDGVDFEMDIIGDGELKDALSQSIKEKGLQTKVRLLGAISPRQVREEMEKAGVFVFTSDFNEGWGAVLNEAMNSGCAVVASHAVGAVPFLIKHGENGLVYENGSTKDLYRKVKTLLIKAEKQAELGEKAYNTITKLWNASVAAKRFMALTEEIKKTGSCALFEDGPCSKAEVIKNNWFKEADYGVSWIEN